MDFLTQWLADREVCVSEGVRDFTRSRAHVSASKLVVIPNAVEPLAATRPRAAMRAELGATGDDLVVCSIGRLDAQKGYEYLIDAAARTLASHGNALFVVAGEGDRRADLETKIARAGIGGRFKLLGWRRDIADLYNAADVFVLPSLWEGMPNSVLEAATFGLPIIATAVEGSREVIEDAKTGLLVRAGDSGALWEALDRLLGDGDLRSALGREAAKYVASKHTVERFVAAHEELYRSILSARQVQGDACVAPANKVGKGRN
jgi:glycosyltransferase involved in cell wall biosynthesis